MDREKLLKKRNKLKAKIYTSVRIGLIRELINYLDSKKVEYNLHLECDRVFKKYPTNFSGLNWGIIPNSQLIHYHTIEQRNQIISNALTEYLNKSDRVFVVWSNGLTPILELSVKQLMDNIEPIVNEDFDMWILQLEKGFCLEHYHEGYVAWTINS